MSLPISWLTISNKMVFTKVCLLNNPLQTIFTQNIRKHDNEKVFFSIRSLRDKTPERYLFIAVLYTNNISLIHSVSDKIV